jgi:hypothetical protein
MDADIAQLVEHSLRKRKVIGSIPIVGSSLKSNPNPEFENSVYVKKAFLGEPPPSFSEVTYFLGKTIDSFGREGLARYRVTELP